MGAGRMGDGCMGDGYMGDGNMGTWAHGRNPAWKIKDAQVQAQGWVQAGLPFASTRDSHTCTSLRGLRGGV